MRLALSLFLGAALFLPTMVLAQVSSTSPAERRDQIAKVQEMLADPDPMMRLANMEAVVNSGDSLKLLVALRTALSSDDADLRGLAMRAYLATRKDITFNVVLPATIQKQFEAAQFDQAALQDLGRKYLFLPTLLSISSKIHLRFKDYAITQDQGSLETDRIASFSIMGDRLSSFAYIPAVGFCYIDFAPTRKLTFEGALACGPWPKLTISAQVF